MARITFSIPDETAAMAGTRAASEKRSVSAYIALLIEADLRAAGVMPEPSTPDHAELLAKITAALEANPSLRTDLERVITRSARTRRAKQETVAA